MKFSIAKITNFFSYLIFAVIFAVSTLSSTISQAAEDYGVGRIRTCQANAAEDVEMEQFESPFNISTGGKEISFDLTNPVCLAIATSGYAAVKLAIATMNASCGTGSYFPRITPSPFLDAADLAKAAQKAVTNLSCKAAFTSASTAFIAEIGAFGIVYEEAKRAFPNASICGANWEKPGKSTYKISVPDYKATVTNYVNSATTVLNEISDQQYREWLYGGVEVEDNPADGDVCRDPYETKKDGNYPPQKYYLKGTEAGNFRCDRYLVSDGDKLPDGATQFDMENAYNCCVKRSQEYICIKYYDTKAFCRVGEPCNINGSYGVNNSITSPLTFIAKSADDGRLICAETYNLCPYNFTVGGGTEICDYFRDGTWDESSRKWKIISDEELANNQCNEVPGVSGSTIRDQQCSYNNKANKCRNYCQYLRHCTATSGSTYRYKSGLTSPYFSNACLNFVGDSQNKTPFRGGFLIGEQRHFSAPIAQCARETLENLFYNRAGHSKCANESESPTIDGTCRSGLYFTDSNNFSQKKGNRVQEVSFFNSIQNNLQMIVKLVLTLSVMFFGMNILLLKTNLSGRKEIITYLLKIGLVIYFATGTAWQSIFFDGVYKASAQVSDLFFKIQVSRDSMKLDGCQFGRTFYTDGTMASISSYPKGKEYLAIWDTLDCKIMRYLGFAPGVSAGNIAMLILASFFTGAVGIYFALSVLIFGIILIAITIRALHIFLAASIAIIIFIFVSPIIIPMVLFEKTKGIFDGWLKELIGFCLHPIILFAYVGIFIFLMDKVLIGSATFNGAVPQKVLICSEICKDSQTASVFKKTEPGFDACAEKNKVINPLDDSAACLLAFDKFGTFPGFEIIGLPIPILINLFSANVLARLLTILKAALLMYLLYKFMDEIPGICTDLIGSPIDTNPDAFKMFNKVLGMARAIQKRAARASYNIGKSTGRSMKDAANNFGNQGKEESAESGSSHSGNSEAEGGGSSHTGSGEGGGSSNAGGDSNNGASNVRDGN